MENEDQQYIKEIFEQFHNGEIDVLDLMEELETAKSAFGLRKNSNVSGPLYNRFTKERGKPMNISVEKLIEMKVLRESMFGSGDWYVIYTEDGPKDVSLAELTAE
ncbi:MAG: hypothetical protein EBR82_63430 [Caulobacteraceae bacterium]|nr:hypothetical protein [Caulobacteraceae bacterium]